MPIAAHADLLVAHEARPRHATAFGPFGVLAGLFGNNVGLAYSGIERGTRHGGAPPMSASSWASFAYRANLRAQAAEQEARQALDAAARHEWIARASAEQSRAALLEAKQLPEAASVQTTALRPFMRFCKEVASYVDAHPHRASDLAVLRLRRFCGGLDAHLDHVMRNGATAATDMGLHYYDNPPAEYPLRPMWPPAVPVFHASVQGLEPVLPAGTSADHLEPMRSFL
mmetsp:Transcript_12020/g.27272  ORF Transcript_12020/g.27272 Transcript_12020/m.27272 type:complete len:228 (-) Transcript_12020:115-798(-)